MPFVGSLSEAADECGLACDLSGTGSRERVRGTGLAGRDLRARPALDGCLEADRLIKLKGEAGSDGHTSLGVGAEWE